VSLCPLGGLPLFKAASREAKSSQYQQQRLRNPTRQEKRKTRPKAFSASKPHCCIITPPSLPPSLPLNLPRQVHPMEIRQNLRPLHILRHQLKLPVALLLIPTLELSQVHLEHTALQPLGSDLRAGGTRDERLAHGAGLEVARGLDVVPLLLQEGVGAVRRRREEEGE